MPTSSGNLWLGGINVDDSQSIFRLYRVKVFFFVKSIKHTIRVHMWSFAPPLSHHPVSSSFHHRRSNCHVGVTKVKDWKVFSSIIKKETQDFHFTKCSHEAYSLIVDDRINDTIWMIYIIREAGYMCVCYNAGWCDSEAPRA